jgi:hypothetical protein
MAKRRLSCVTDPAPECARRCAACERARGSAPRAGGAHRAAAAPRCARGLIVAQPPRPGSSYLSGQYCCRRCLLASARDWGVLAAHTHLTDLEAARAEETRACHAERAGRAVGTATCLGRSSPLACQRGSQAGTHEHGGVGRHAGRGAGRARATAALGAALELAPPGADGSTAKAATAGRRQRWAASRPPCAVCAGAARAARAALMRAGAALAARPRAVVPAAAPAAAAAPAQAACPPPAARQAAAPAAPPAAPP